jgi:uncharacterized protein YciU (UPF0263 family)
MYYWIECLKENFFRTLIKLFFIKMTELSNEDLIKYIIAKRDLTEDIEAQILNNLWNLGFREGANFDIMDQKTKEWQKIIKLAFRNNFYNGILIGLMYNYKDDQVEPFYPITQKLKPNDPLVSKMQAKTDEWETDMLGLRALRKEVKKTQTTRKRIKSF